MLSKPNISVVRSIFASSVKRWRIHRDLTQEELAERADLHRTYISDVERGARNLSLESIDKLARALDISLPILFTPEETPGDAAANRSSAPSPESLEIVLVESNSQEADQTVEVFTSARLSNSIRVVTDGLEALDLVFGRGAFADGVRNPGDLIVLLELDLPKASGLEVLRQLKSDKRTANLPVVILANSDKHRDLPECRRLGATAIMTKPLSFQGLSKVIPALNLSWALIRPPAISPQTPSTAAV